MSGSYVSLGHNVMPWGHGSKGLYHSHLKIYRELRGSFQEGSLGLG